jgi:hypothetical protein
VLKRPAAENENQNENGNTKTEIDCDASCFPVSDFIFEKFDPVCPFFGGLLS